ncbi:hypothetical protein ARMSODRAFT_1026876 [Armillaria solidipes]|uniref:Uncharacterized protein n=1 Tax=Armillaria solidipes TaxID=1076256 RepID=A0A2H3ATP8_9AGAR|nr:hypothetical protein ARMSODRAFT_1026876 [Armillaria solidipes]
MAPIRSSKSSLSFLQPSKRTWHKQHVCRCNESSEPEDGKATKKSFIKPSTMKKTKKKKKKLTTTVDTADEGDKSEDKAPADMDENEKALKKAIVGWTSAVYDYYHLPPSIKVEDGTVKYVFTCKQHGITYTHAKKDTSTTNLKNHAE